MTLPVITKEHECPQTEKVLRIAEDHLAEVERLTKALNFWKGEAARLQTRCSDLERELQSAVVPV